MHLFRECSKHVHGQNGICILSQKHGNTMWFSWMDFCSYDQVLFSSVEWSNSSFLHRLLFHAWTEFSESYTYAASLLFRKLKKSILQKSVLFILLFLARKSPHHCSSRSPRADHRQPCPCSTVIPNLFPGTSLVTQMFFWRPFPLCFLLFSVSSHWHPSVLNTSLEKDPLSWWQQSKFWVSIPCTFVDCIFCIFSNSQPGWAGEGTTAWASPCDVNHPLPLKITLPARSKVNRDWQERKKNRKSDGVRQQMKRWKEMTQQTQLQCSYCSFTAHLWSPTCFTGASLL